MKTTRKQRDIVKSFIQTELLKRGFKARITFLNEIKDSDRSQLVFSTESFQTTPVLFKNIWVKEGVSVIGEPLKTEAGEKYLPFYIGIDVRYEHFDLGVNGCTLFNVEGRIFKDNVTALKAYN